MNAVAKRVDLEHLTGSFLSAETCEGVAECQCQEENNPCLASCRTDDFRVAQHILRCMVCQQRSKDRRRHPDFDPTVGIRIAPMIPSLKNPPSSGTSVREERQKMNQNRSNRDVHLCRIDLEEKGPALYADVL